MVAPVNTLAKPHHRQRQGEQQEQVTPQQHQKPVQERLRLCNMLQHGLGHPNAVNGSQDVVG